MQIRILVDAITNNNTLSIKLPPNVQYIAYADATNFKSDYVVQFVYGNLAVTVDPKLGVTAKNYIGVNEYDYIGVRDSPQSLATGFAENEGAWFMTPEEIAAIKPIDESWSGFVAPEKSIPNKYSVRAKKIPDDVVKAISNGNFFFGYASGGDVARAAFVDAAVGSLKPPLPENVYFVMPAPIAPPRLVGRLGSQIQSIQSYYLPGAQYSQDDELTIGDFPTTKIEEINDSGVRVHLLYGSFSHEQFLQAMKHSNQKFVLVTGDQSLTEAISLNKLPIYQALDHKLTLLEKLKAIPGDVGNWFKNTGFYDQKNGENAQEIKNKFTQIQQVMAGINEHTETSKLLHESFATLPIKYDASFYLQKKLDALMARPVEIRP